MAFIHKSDDDLPPKQVSVSQATQKLRFRAAVIAVIAARRLICWPATSCRLCTVHSGLLRSAQNVLCIGYVPPYNSHQSVDGILTVCLCHF